MRGKSLFPRYYYLMFLPIKSLTIVSKKSQNSLIFKLSMKKWVIQTLLFLDITYP
nr:MAG TPA: hypothetical protein [Bacteriophage sp.]